MAHGQTRVFAAVFGAALLVALSDQNTGDPTWVDGLVPGRGSDTTPEQDYMFSLYRRSRIYAYARLRGDAADPPTRMQLILGVIRKPPDHGDE